MDLMTGIIYGATGLFGVIALFESITIVGQTEIGLVERLGKYNRSLQSGLNFKIPFIEGVAKLNTQIEQLQVEVETKTKDNVFVKVKVSVQNKIFDAFKAHYTLDDPTEQLESFVYDAVRAQVPKMTLDELFEKKDEISVNVKTQLKESMDDFGFNIVQALVTDIDPDANVKQAMNEINAAQRQRVAATEQAEAQKILLVKKAEGEAEEKRLQGEGIAQQRAAIIKGLKNSVEELKAATGGEADEVMSLILATQYFDTLKVFGEKGANTILLSSDPNAATNIQQQIMTGMMASRGGSNKTVSKTIQ